MCIIRIFKRTKAAGQNGKYDSTFGQINPLRSRTNTELYFKHEWPLACWPNVFYYFNKHTLLLLLSHKTHAFLTTAFTSNHPSLTTSEEQKIHAVAGSELHLLRLTSSSSSSSSTNYSWALWSFLQHCSQLRSVPQHQDTHKIQSCTYYSRSPFATDWPGKRRE